VLHVQQHRHAQSPTGSLPHLCPAFDDSHIILILLFLLLLLLFVKPANPASGCCCCCLAAEWQAELLALFECQLAAVLQEGVLRHHQVQVLISTVLDTAV
jgi:hypothetical protein